MAQNSGKYKDLYAAAERKEKADQEGDGAGEAEEKAPSSPAKSDTTLD
jgi:hypothetical protein